MQHPSLDKMNTAPDGEAAHEAYRRLVKAIEQSGRLGITALRPTDLRYAFEITATINDVLAKLLIDSGLLDGKAFQVAVIEALNERAALFEQRIHARLDGDRSMPR